MALEPFGGWAAVFAVFLHYLADLHAKRTLQREASELGQKVADLSHELKLRESAYTKHLELLIRYYEVFYRHYRICQSAANHDAHKFPDGNVVKTRDTFWEKLDACVQNWPHSKDQLGYFYRRPSLTFTRKALRHSINSRTL